jgi:hypothetical protein
MSSSGSCSAIGKPTFALSSASPSISASTSTAPAAASRPRARSATGASVPSSPAQNDGGTPSRSPASGTGAAGPVPVIAASSSARSATVRPMGPTVSRVRLIGTTAPGSA